MLNPEMGMMEGVGRAGSCYQTGLPAFQQRAPASRSASDSIRATVLWPETQVLPVLGMRLIRDEDL